MTKIIAKITFFPILFLFLIVQPSYAIEKASVSSAVLEKPVNIIKPDYRAKILEEFLESYNSPLASFSGVFVASADKYNLDWKLLASISGVESTFGRNIPANSYNALGWGIYGYNVIYFSSYDEAIETISKELKENYIDKWGAQDVYQIGRFYATSPAWASRVLYFMEKIDELASQSPTYTLPISL